MKIRITLCAILLLAIVPLNANAGLFGYADKEWEQKQSQVKEYFKDPKNKLLIVIDQIGVGDMPSVGIDISNFSMWESGTHSSQGHTNTPVVIVQDYNKEVEDIAQSYAKLSDAEKSSALLYLDMKMPPMSITASSEYAQKGLKIAVYFDGEEIASDSSSLDYPIVSVGWSIPLSKVIKKYHS